jgi:hypothetical protein
VSQYKSRKNRKRALINRRVFITPAVLGQGHTRDSNIGITQLGDRIGIPRTNAADASVRAVLSMLTSHSFRGQK